MAEGPPVRALWGRGRPWLLLLLLLLLVVGGFFLLLLLLLIASSSTCSSVFLFSSSSSSDNPTNALPDPSAHSASPGHRDPEKKRHPGHHHQLDPGRQQLSLDALKQGSAEAVAPHLLPHGQRRDLRDVPVGPDQRDGHERAACPQQGGVEAREIELAEPGLLRERSEVVVVFAFAFSSVAAAAAAAAKDRRDPRRRAGECKRQDVDSGRPGVPQGPERVREDVARRVEHAGEGPGRGGVVARRGASDRGGFHHRSPASSCFLCLGLLGGGDDGGAAHERKSQSRPVRQGPGGAHAGGGGLRQGQVGPPGLLRGVPGARGGLPLSRGRGGGGGGRRERREAGGVAPRASARARGDSGAPLPRRRALGGLLRHAVSAIVRRS